MANLTPRPNGNFSYLPGSGIYCRGAVADPGFTLVHATLQKPAPLAQGFALIQQHLAGMGRLTSSLCGLELRIAQPLTFDGFGALSANYIKLLDQYVLRDGVNGLTVDFFAVKKLAERINYALEHPKQMQALRNAARATAVRQFDLKRVLLPRWLRLFDDLVSGRRPV